MEYNLISLGPTCITKYAINNMNYYSPTLPFDWMFSSLTFIQKVLMNNFELLINKEYIITNNPCYGKNASLNVLYNEEILKSKNITNHLLIKNEICDFNNFHMWRHYNLVEEELYIKYIKYVERFKELIKSNKLKIFLFIQYYDNNNIEEIELFNEYLKNNITNYKFICIKCSKVNNKTFDFKCSYNKNNLYIYDLEIFRYQDYIEESDLLKIKKEIDTFLYTLEDLSSHYK
jgi:hypothetical protein